MKKFDNERKENVIPFPNLEERLLQKGKEYLQKRRFKDALRVFQQFTSHSFQSMEVELGIVVCLFELGQYEEAKRKCEELLQYGTPDYYSVLQTYITILIHLSDYNRVVTILEALFEEEKVPSAIANRLYHLLEFSRKKMEAQKKIKPDHLAFAKHQLFSKNVNEQLFTIRKLNEQASIEEVMEELKEMLQSDTVHPVIKSFILQLMEEKNIKETVLIRKFGREMNLIPSERKDVFTQPFAIQVRKILDDSIANENPSLFEMIKEVWQRFLFVNDPFLPEPIDAYLWAGALHAYGCHLIGIDISMEKLEQLYQVETEKLQSAYQQIFEIEKMSIWNGI